MRVDGGAGDDSGGVPCKLVIACRGDLEWYRQNLVVWHSPPESGSDVAVEVTLGCSAGYKYQGVTGCDRPTVVVPFNHGHPDRKVERFTEQSYSYCRSPIQRGVFTEHDERRSGRLVEEMVGTVSSSSAVIAMY